jgi:hypothetical protein
MQLRALRAGLQSIELSLPTGYLGNAMAALNNLSDCFDLELFGISFAAHIHLSGCHFVWLKGV